MKTQIYVHIPFCAKKCAYCDFESYAGRLDQADEYLNHVLAEARAAREQYGLLGVSSVYIGGGTPSLLSAEQIRRLFDGLSNSFQMENGAEVSMEANPGTVTKEKLKSALESGVNRLSFGAQAAQERLLGMLGRIHLWPDVEKAVETARDTGFDNYNLDLMYALPGQSKDDFAESIEWALKLNPAHLSCYSLILEEGTPLFERVQRGELTPPGEDADVEMQRLAAEICEKNGLSRYEISNYARPGMECRHNIGYWTRENYLGLGCAAHSLMNEIRFSNPDYARYMNGETRVEEEIISAREAMEESVMLETRMSRGLDLLRFERLYGSEMRIRIVRAGEELQKMGLARLKADSLSLTPRGMDVQNAAVLKLINALDGKEYAV